ncbi:MAG: hypothetical protein SGARI_007505 [Bacillariaceae sp.]
MMDKHLALTCGRCHGKTLLKGPKQQNSIGGEINEGNSEKQHSVGKDQRKQQNNRKRPRYAANVKKTPAESTEENFVALPPPPAAATNTKPMSLIEQKLASSSKKKKTRPPKQNESGKGKKGNLMNFLSSLNDH